MNDELGQILSELADIRRTGQDTRERVIALQEQVKPITDHETRIRSLEHWKWGLTGLIAVLSMALTAWTNMKGSA